MNRIRLITAALFLFGSGSIYAQVDSLQGLCYQGGVPAVVSGLKSTNYLDGVIPYCSITVYLTGTTTKATIYSNATGTTLTNPFFATKLGSATPGSWLFYVSDGTGVDVIGSGGIPPNAYPNAVPLLVDAKVGGGGGGGCIGSSLADVTSTNCGTGNQVGNTGTSVSTFGYTNVVDANASNFQIAVGTNNLNRPAAGTENVLIGDGNLNLPTGATLAEASDVIMQGDNNFGSFNGATNPAIHLSDVIAISDSTSFTSGSAVVAMGISPCSMNGQPSFTLDNVNCFGDGAGSDNPSVTGALNVESADFMGNGAGAQNTGNITDFEGIGDGTCGGFTSGSHDCAGIGDDTATGWLNSDVPQATVSNLAGVGDEVAGQHGNGSTSIGGLGELAAFQQGSYEGVDTNSDDIYAVGHNVCDNLGANSSDVFCFGHNINAATPGTTLTNAIGIGHGLNLVSNQAEFGDAQTTDTELHGVTHITGVAGVAGQFQPSVGTDPGSVTGTATYTTDTTNGYAEVHEGTAALSRVCTAGNGVCSSAVPAGPATAVQIANSGVTAFDSDSTILVNKSTHTLTTPNQIIGNSQTVYSANPDCTYNSVYYSGGEYNCNPNFLSGNTGTAFGGNYTEAILSGNTGGAAHNDVSVFAVNGGGRGHQNYMSKNGTGDAELFDSYFGCDSGASRPSDQGCEAFFMNMGEFGPPESTVASGGSGAQTITFGAFSCTPGGSAIASAVCVPNPGTRLADTTQTPIVGTLRATSVPATIAGACSAIINQLGTSGSLPITTHFGCSTTAVTPNTTLDAPISETISVTLGAGAGAFTSSSLVCVAGANGNEQSKITAASSVVGGVQTLTLPLALNNTSQFVMQSDDTRNCGLFYFDADAAINALPSYIYIGSVDGTNALYTTEDFGNAGSFTIPQLSVEPEVPAELFPTSTAVSVGTNIFDGTNVQFVTVAGTTGSSAPSWNPTVGGTTTSGGVTFANQGPVSGFHVYAAARITKDNFIASGPTKVFASASLEPNAGRWTASDAVLDAAFDFQKIHTWYSSQLCLTVGGECRPATFEVDGPGFSNSAVGFNIINDNPLSMYQNTTSGAPTGIAMPDAAIGINDGQNVGPGLFANLIKTTTSPAAAIVQINNHIPGQKGYYVVSDNAGGGAGSLYEDFTNNYLHFLNQGALFDGPIIGHTAGSPAIFSEFQIPAIAGGFGPATNLVQFDSYHSGTTPTVISLADTGLSTGGTDLCVRDNTTGQTAGIYACNRGFQASTFNGVPLTTTGSLSLFLNQAGGYTTAAAHSDYANIPPALFATSTMLGPVFLEPLQVHYKTIIVRMSGTISCSAAPIVALMDLGTSPTTAFASAVGNVDTVTTGTSDGVYQHTASVNMTPGDYYGFAFTAGTCTAAPTFDITAQVQ